MKAYIRTHKYVLALLYLPVYLLWYIWIEKRPMPEYYVVYTPLDDWIPFCEWFILPYVCWYGYMFVVGMYLMTQDHGEFLRCCVFVFGGLSLCLLICTVFPNGQNLRPKVFPRENLLTSLIQGIYAADTNTNVLPSMHVLGSLAIHTAVHRSQTPILCKRGVRLASLILCVLICISTVFVKQHSVLDGLAAIVLFVPLDVWIYHWHGGLFSGRRQKKDAPAA